MMAAEMASFYALQGLTLIDRLEELYKEYGYYAEKTVNLVMPGLDGLEKSEAAYGRASR
jgi:phosphoglucomutase